MDSGLQNEVARQDQRLTGLEARMTTVEGAVAGFKALQEDTHRRIEALAATVATNTDATAKATVEIARIETRRETEDRQREMEAKRGSHRVSIIALLVSISAVGFSVVLKMLGY